MFVEHRATGFGMPEQRVRGDGVVTRKARDGACKAVVKVVDARLATAWSPTTCR